MRRSAAAGVLVLTLWCLTMPAVRAATPTTTPTTAGPPTVAPIPAGTATPSTLPLSTRQPSAHVSGIFPILAIAGFLLVLLMLAAQWFLTRPGRRRGWTL